VGRKTLTQSINHILHYFIALTAENLCHRSKTFVFGKKTHLTWSDSKKTQASQTETETNGSNHHIVVPVKVGRMHFCFSSSTITIVRLVTEAFPTLGVVFVNNQQMCFSRCSWLISW